MGISYSDAGVDIDRGDEFVRLIKGKLGDRGSGLGLFGGVFDLEGLGMNNPVLVAGTDGVGTKLLLAKASGIFNTIGIDLVAMCVNDIITMGAKPLFFLDYMATARLDLEHAGQVMDGIIEGCRQAGCVLLGGETAEMPGVYAEGDYELAGFAVGAAEKEKLVTGSGIEAGDVVLGLRSSGIHSNGLSLARKSLFEAAGYRYEQSVDGLGRPLVRELLEPTRIYVQQVLQVLKRFPIKGIAHITGGGLEGNIVRLLPEGLGVRLFWGRIKPHPVFEVIRKAGSVEEQEMRRTFNMGIGLALVVDPAFADQASGFLAELGETCGQIGVIQRQGRSTGEEAADG
jgi:phosphoribosylformylglycinamidine cyclo-ligase